MRRSLRLLAALSLFAVCCQAANAQLTIDANFSTPDTTDFPGSTPIAGPSSTLTAAQITETEDTIDAAIAEITSNVTTLTPVTVTVDFVNDPNTALGTTQSAGNVGISYADYVADLTANPDKSANDVTALASLAANPEPSNTVIDLPAANLGAIGDTTDENTILNGNGGINATTALNLGKMNLSRPDSNVDDYDLQATVNHEVDEVLGIGGAGSTLNQGQTTPTPTEIGSMDLFRYSASGTRTYTNSATGPAYFSIDNGKTNLVNFNQKEGGDFGDWGDGVLPPDGQGNSPGQVQDAFAGPDVAPDMGPNELTALDVVGYDLTPQGMQLDGLATPEPGTVSLVLLGLLALGIQSRRRKAI